MLTHFTPTASRTFALMISLTGLVLMSGCGASSPMSSVGGTEESDRIANEFEDPSAVVQVEPAGPVAQPQVKPAVAPPAYKPTTQLYVETDASAVYSDRVGEDFDDETVGQESADAVSPGNPIEDRVHMSDEPGDGREQSGDE